MGVLSAKLDQLEIRLRTLIEGRLARLIPVQHSQKDLVQRLVAAMKEGVSQQDSDYLLAPDVYYLLVHPENADGLFSNPPFLQGLASVIQEAGADAGLRFLQPPVVKISPNPDITFHHIEVLARTSQAPLGETAAMTSAPDETGENLPPNAFLIVNGVKIFPLVQSLVNVGRRSNNELVIDDPRISRNHAQLRAVRGKYMISDLGSTGGTFVNGKRITQVILNPRDVISLAGVPLVYGQEENDFLGETQKFDFPPSSDEDQPTKNSRL